MPTGSPGPYQRAAALLIAVGPGSVPLAFLGMTGCVLNLDPTQILFSLPGTSDGAGTVRIPLPLPESLLTPYELYFQFAYGSPGANAAHLQGTLGLRTHVR